MSLWRAKPTCPRRADLVILYTYDSKQKFKFFFLQMSKWDMTQINFLLTHNKFFLSLCMKNILWQEYNKYNKYINNKFISWRPNLVITSTTRYPCITSLILNVWYLGTLEIVVIIPPILGSGFLIAFGWCFFIDVEFLACWLCCITLIVAIGQYLMQWILPFRKHWCLGSHGSLQVKHNFFLLSSFWVSSSSWSVLVSLSREIFLC